jgi:hypothetical protein
MSGGTVETYLDNDYLATGTHKGADASSSLYDPGADFASCGIVVGAFIENDTGAEYGWIESVAEDTIGAGDSSETGYDVYAVLGGATYLTSSGETYQLAGGSGGSGISWDYGDTYYIYATASKNSVKSRTRVDLSRGWKTPIEKMKDGWRHKDIDLDRQGNKIFGHGQPE